MTNEMLAAVVVIGVLFAAYLTVTVTRAADKAKALKELNAVKTDNDNFAAETANGTRATGCAAETAVVKDCETAKDSHAAKACESDDTEFFIGDLELKIR